MAVLSHHSVLYPSLLFLFLLISPSVCREKNSDAHHFTSVQKLEGLLRNESHVIDAMRATVKEMRMFLAEMKLFLQELKDDHNASKEELKQGNPIAIFKMMKRMSVDVRNFIPEMESFRTNAIIPKSAASNGDLIGTVKAIFRISDVYEYPLEDIILNGTFGNLETKTGLSADEIQVFYLTTLYGEIDPFMQDSDPGMIVSRFNQSVFESLLEKSFGLNSSNEVLYNDSPLIMHYKRLFVPFIEYKEDFNVERFESLLRARFSKFAQTEELDLERLKEYIRKQNRQFMNPLKPTHFDSFYNKACQGNLPVPEQIRSRLKCYYESYTNPFLKIGPFKMEELNLEPRIIKIHDAIPQSEIDEIIEFSKEKIKRARVAEKPSKDMRTNTTVYKYSENRLANSFFIFYQLRQYQSFYERMIPRINDMTDLMMTEAELFMDAMQSANYGLGGYYDIHHDSTTKREYGLWRLATLMFYLTDVELGGATIFPSLNLTVFPDKGSAILWYNNHANTLMDFRTFHSGCPVVVGNKWVLNQWIRETGQMFTRPCVYGELMTDLKDQIYGYWDKLSRGNYEYFTPNVSAQYALM